MIAKDNLRDVVLNNFNQIKLFAKYLNIKEELIKYCLKDKNNKISNPLRKDDNPSVSFIYNRKKLYYKDWAVNEFSGDIFDLVALLTNKNVTKDFVTICKFIINNNNIDSNIKIDSINHIENNPTIIDFDNRIFEKRDYDYWIKGGVNLYHLQNRNTYAASKVWIKDLSYPALLDTKNNPIYVYYLDRIDDTIIYKVYSPFANKGFKFFTNNRKGLEAINELYIAQSLIIIKSRKDKFVVESLLEGENGTISDELKRRKDNNISKFDNLHEFCITSFNSESYRLTSRDISYLKQLYDNIYVFVDYDKAGVVNAFYHYILYGITPILLANNKNLSNEFTKKEVKSILNKIHSINPYMTLYINLFYNFLNDLVNDYDVKDIFDYVSKYGIEKGKNLLNNLFKT